MILLCSFIGNILFGQTVSNKEQIIYDHHYYSNFFGAERNYRIFLPLGYNEDSSKHYPVIYFFHGFMGRYNGPYGTDPNGDMESRYYDAWTGNVKLCGPDSLDNIEEFVKNNEVIVAKWDGYVASQWPRPYDVGPVKDDIQFVNYFLEFVNYIDANYRTIPTRAGRAVSGLSMGGFMSLFVASKYPHLLSSASFFNPGAAFSIGNKATQVYTEFKDLAINYTGLPIRMHIGLKDFLRQSNEELDESFKQLGLSYESWHYGENYYDGFHTVANVKDMFNFHMKYFTDTPSIPEKWDHIDLFPDFKIWNYTVTSDRTKSGYCILKDVNKQGFKISTRAWLPDGPFYSDVTTNILTDSIYFKSTDYYVDILNVEDQSIVSQVVKSDSSGRLNITVSSGNCEVGIYKTGNPAKVSIAGFKSSKMYPTVYEDIRIDPIIYNKGGASASNVTVEFISQDDNIRVITSKKTISFLAKGGINNTTSFWINGRNPSVDHGKIKVLVTTAGKTETFIIDFPFYTPDFELTDINISDGLSFRQKAEGLTVFGQGNKNGIVEPGEKFSILTMSEFSNEYYYGLKLYTDDPYIDQTKTSLKYSERDDWSGSMRLTSELYVKPDCPTGHVIKLFGVYDYQLPGNISRDSQASQSFIHEINKVSLAVTVGGNITSVGQTSLSEDECKVYPMPNNGNFYIDMGSSEYNNLRIFDLNGKELLTRNINSNLGTVSIQTNLKSGLYLVVLNNNSGSATKKMWVK